MQLWYRIDTRLIMIARYLVRQFDLFTPWSRYILGRYLLGIFRYSISAWAIFAVLAVFTDPLWFIFLPSPIFGLLLYLNLKHSFDRQYDDTNLSLDFYPSEVTTRMLFRFLAVHCFVILTLFGSGTMLIPDKIALKGNMLFLLGVTLLTVLFEYFLCTSLFSHKKAEEELEESKA